MMPPPTSATVSGLIAPVGVKIPAVMVAPALWAATWPEDGLGEEVLELSQPATLAASTGTEIPTTLPRRKNSRREIRPAANSSMT
jgi:hypothetical protein